MSTSEPIKQELSAKEQAYLAELAADIAAHGGFAGASVEDALKAAHERRKAFALEMAMGATKRGQMARKVLQAQVWNRVRAEAARKRLDMQTKDSIRSALLACERIDESK